MATLEHEIGSDLESDLPDRATLLRWYRTMVTARNIDDREAKLHKQGKVFFLIAGAGHEAVQVALADFLRPGSDWFYLYYRDRALALALGVPPMEQLLQGMGAERDPASGGRHMPAHYGDRPGQHRCPLFAPRYPVAERGWAPPRAGLRATITPKLASTSHFADDEDLVCTTGDWGHAPKASFLGSHETTGCNARSFLSLRRGGNEYAIRFPVDGADAAAASRVTDRLSRPEDRGV